MTGTTPWQVVATGCALAQEQGWPTQVCSPARIQKRNPSSTLARVMEEILLNPRPFYENHILVQKGDPGNACRQLARLYSATQDKLPESYYHVIPQGYLTDQGTPATANREILTEFQLENWGRARCYFLASCKHAPVFLPGRWFPILTFYPNNYAHWLMDALPLTALLEHVPGEVSLLLPAVQQPYHQDSLRLLGLDRYPVRMAARMMQVESLILPFSAAFTGVPRQEHLLKIQKRLWQGAGAEPKLKKRLYISRAGAQQRKLINETELEPLLDEYGFTTVVPETLSFAEQIRLFAQAELVLGPHGAGMMNQLFAPAGAQIVEIFNPSFWHENNARIASLLGQRHWHLFGKNVNRLYDTTVEIEQLKKLLQFILETGPAS